MNYIKLWMVSFNPYRNRITIKVLGTFALILVTVSAVGQKVYVGEARHQTYLYQKPVLNGEYPFVTDPRDTIRNGDLVYCFSLLDTALGGKPVKMAKCVYKQKVGYVPYSSVEFKEGGMGISSKFAGINDVNGAEAGRQMEKTDLSSRKEKEKTSACEQIDYDYDEFDNSKKWSTPYSFGTEMLPIHVIKYLEKGRYSYYLILYAYGSSVVVDGKGVKLIFTDGTRLDKPLQKIKVNAGTSGFEYSAFIALTASEFQSFKNKVVKKFRLYIFDTEVESSKAEYFKTMVTCISKSK